MNVSYPEKSTEKTTGHLLFPYLLFEFKFTLFIKNMPNEVKNIKEIVIWRETQNYQLPSNNRLTNLLKTYNGLNEQRLSKKLE